MVSKKKEILAIQCINDIEAFTELIDKKYSSLFNNGYFKMVVHPTISGKIFPYEVSLEITSKK